MSNGIFKDYNLVRVPISTYKVASLSRDRYSGKTLINKI